MNKLGTVSRKVRHEFPTCQVCERRPSKETAHLVSRKELKQRGSRGRRYFYDRSNLAALCKLCHDALDFHLGLTAWWIQQHSPAEALQHLTRHFTTHRAAFSRLLHRRNLVLVEMDDPRPTAGTVGGSFLNNDSKDGGCNPTNAEGPAGAVTPTPGRPLVYHGAAPSQGEDKYASRSNPKGLPSSGPLGPR